MNSTLRLLGRIAGYFLVVVVLLQLTWITKQAYDRSVYKTTIIKNVRIEGDTVIRPGDNISVSYDVARFDTCSIQITRVITGTHGREYTVQEGAENFFPTNGFVKSGFVVVIPQYIQPGHYTLTSYVRFFCNALDYLSPRFSAPNEKSVINFEVVGNSSRNGSVE